MTLRAIYQDGVFKPAGPVDLPDESVVELQATLVETGDSSQVRGLGAQTEIMDILSRRYNTGQTDAAARHDEHQP
jgi:predicted DNA-binding antitoxin AbrB/MazE fold protein